MIAVRTGEVVRADSGPYQEISSVRSILSAGTRICQRSTLLPTVRDRTLVGWRQNGGAMQSPQLEKYARDARARRDCAEVNYAAASELFGSGNLSLYFPAATLVLFPFAALLINLSLARSNETWTPARRILLWTAGLPLFGFLAFAVYSAIFVFPLGPGAYGPGVNIGRPPRFAFLTYLLWVVVLGWQATRCSRRASAELQRKG